MLSVELPFCCTSKEIMAKIAFKRANIITGDSPLLQKSGFQIGARKEHNYIIQNGVDRKMFHSRIEKGVIRKQYDIQDETKVILSTRLLTKNYNIECKIRHIF